MLPTRIHRRLRCTATLGLLVTCSLGLRGQADATTTTVAPTARCRLLVFGDPSKNNPPAQVALMEQSIAGVAAAFATHGFEVDLVPTKDLNGKVVRERLADYARTLTSDDTFVLYSHSHGGPFGTFFAGWSRFADSILALPARNVVVFAMSCQSGNLTDKMLARKAEWEGRGAAGRSLVVLTPVDASQNAGPSPEPGIGNPFTHAVISATRGDGDGSSGKERNGGVELQELVDHVLAVTRAKSRDHSYRPQFAGVFPPGATFVTVKPGAAVPPPVTQSGPDRYSDSKALPRTQAYERARELVGILNKGDADAFEAYARTAFAGGFLAALPMAEHRAGFVRLRDENGLLQVHGARTYDPPRPDTMATLIVWSTWLEAWRGVVLEVDGDGKVVGLRLSPARPPSDLPKAEMLTEAQVAERLGGFVDRLAARDAFSGTVLLAREGKILLTKALGIAHRDFDVPVELDTKFNLGSMNKMMTAVACMQLVEQGKLTLDDPIARHLGEDWLPRVDKSKVKVRHLLTHTSGLGSYFTAEFDRSSRALYRTVDDWKPLVRDETLAFEPGTRWQYSNTGMLIAGAVIEKASGTDYYAYVRTHITGPAGMTNTDCYETDKANRRLAVGYEKESGADGAVTWHNNLYQHVVRGGPAGGGYSTVEDLHRFDRALRGEKLLEKASLDQLWRTYPELSSEGYGLGFVVDRSPLGTIVGHSGGFNGISAVLSMYLDAGYTIAVLSNHGEGAATLVEGKARELIAAGR